MYNVPTDKEYCFYITRKAPVFLFGLSKDQDKEGLGHFTRIIFL